MTVVTTYNSIYGPAWDDMRSPATSIPLHGQQGDPTRDIDGTLLFDKTIANQISLIYQMSHSWYQTPVRFHVHWSKTSDSAGDVEWEYRYRFFNNNAIPPDWSAWIAATMRSQAIGEDQTVLIDGFDMLDLTGIVESGFLSIQCRRNPDAADDTYAAMARLWEADVHFQRFGLGSGVEFPV